MRNVVIGWPKTGEQGFYPPPLASPTEFVCNRSLKYLARRWAAMAVYEMSINVRTQYLEEQSEPDRSHYVFAYAVTIKNTGTVAAQIISRHWVIADASGKTQEVRGLGVVGHQPLLQPGQQFEYTSGTSLATPQGTMHGEYFCVAEDGHRFEVPIPEFGLSLPRTLH